MPHKFNDSVYKAMAQMRMNNSKLQQKAINSIWRYLILNEPYMPQLYQEFLSTMPRNIGSHVDELRIVAELTPPTVDHSPPSAPSQTLSLSLSQQPHIVSIPASLAQHQPAPSVSPTVNLRQPHHLFPLKLLSPLYHEVVVLKSIIQTWILCLFENPWLL